jgi:hypothetical protein
MPGPQGSPGAKGADADRIQLQVSESEFWNRAKAVLGGNVDAWSRYRAQVGEYYFRAYRPDDLALAQYLPLAAGEFWAALHLTPHNTRASSLSQRLQLGQNVLGMARDHHVIPDFPRYEAIITDYGSSVQALFQMALNLLQQAHDVSGNKARLEAEKSRIERSRMILEKEREATTLEKQIADNELKLAEQRIVEHQRAIDQKGAELRAARMDLDNEEIGTVFDFVIAFGAVVVSAVTGGAALAVVPGFVMGARNLWREFEYDETTKTATYRGKTFVDMINWEIPDPADPTKMKFQPHLKPEFKQLVGGLKELYKASKDLYDKYKILQDLDRAKIQVEQRLELEYRELVRKAVELGFERVQAALGVRQKELEQEAIMLRIANAEADVADIGRLIPDMSDDVTRLGSISRNLVGRAREYGDVMNKYVFLAERALEIYTFAPPSAGVAFDYGYVHPDREEDAYRALERASKDGLVALLGEYAASWSRGPELIFYRDVYEAYRARLSADLQFWHFGDEVTLAAFRQGRDIEVIIRLEDLLPERFEAKVDSVFVALVGATASDPRITCILEHGGGAAARRPDGTTVVVSALPQRASIAASKIAGEFGGPQAQIRLAFWGRSPAARWRLFIEPEVMSRSNVDLSGLSGIEVAISYLSL